ncbi:MAG: metallophosphoesterase [Lachnospiraceae bacterium]|nr:metallophosphoesterase [Lachnospiraceae bacterium]
MNDITILHISDLHMHRKNLTAVFRGFLQKIESEQSKWKHVIVVVTGDLVQKRNYSMKEAVIDFFQKLHQALGDKVCGIHIVPGNHDAIYDYEGSSISDEMKLNFGNDKSEIEAYFSGDVIRQVFEEYINLRNEIYCEFGREANDNIWDVSVDEVDGKRFCFIELCSSATSWHQGVKNYNKIYISEKQQDELVAKYQEEENVELTFLLMHHPINWLNKEDERILQNVIMHPDGLNVDFILRGHTHDQDIYYVNKNYRTSMTLVTGFGKPDDYKAEKNMSHMFAVYTVNLDANSMEIYNYHSKQKGTFSVDNTLFTDQQMDKNENKMIFPLHAETNCEYIDLTMIGAGKKPLYFNRVMLGDFKGFYQRMCQFRMKQAENIQLMKKEIFGDVQVAASRYRGITREGISGLKQFYEDRENAPYPKLLRNNDVRNILFKRMDAYLMSFCILFHSLFISENNSIELGRVHFRYGCYDEQAGDFVYRKNVAYSPDEQGKADVSETKWGGLIKGAYEMQHTLVYSVNSESSLKILDQDKWTDYITAVLYSPDFIGKTKDRGETRPLSSFGVTLKCRENKGRNILYFLDYINFSEMIQSMLEECLNETGIRMCEYVNYLREGAMEDVK